MQSHIRKTDYIKNVAVNEQVFLKKTLQDVYKALKKNGLSLFLVHSKH